MYVSILLSTLFIFLLPLPMDAMIMEKNVKQDFPEGVSSPNGELIPKTYGIELKEYNYYPEIAYIKQPLKEIRFNFKRIRKAVDEEREQKEGAKQSEIEKKKEKTVTFSVEKKMKLKK